MSQTPIRKEPTFGTPTENLSSPITEMPKPSIEPTTEKVSNPAERAASPLRDKPPAFSLHSKQVPAYTFTESMKRPIASANLPTMEEQNMKPDNQQPVGENNAKISPLTFAPVVEESVEKNIPSPNIPERDNETKSPEPTVAPLTSERVIPTVQPAAQKAAPTEKVPAKYRRLLIVLLFATALLAAFFLLKPKETSSTEQMQDQGTSLPLEFRPVDEAEAKRAEEQAQQLAQQQATPASQPATNTTQDVAPTDTPAQFQPLQPTPTVVAETAHSPAPESSAPVAVNTPQPHVESKPVEVAKENTVAVIKRPSGSASVIYQPESSTQSEVKKVEKAKAPAPAPVKAEVKKAEATKDVKKVDTVRAADTTKQPAPAAPKPAQAVTPVEKVATPAATNASSKTMTVPKGVSLMQVFRDHQLNISDVNAMSRTNNIVSNLKVGERVTVKLDKDNRVTEMRIGSGGVFTRQADGSYSFK